MFQNDTGVHWSASDLASAALCEYALLRSLDRLEDPEDVSDAAPSPLLDQLAAAGNRHERQVLDDLVATHGDGVVAVARATGKGPAELTDLVRRTTDALGSGADVVFQAGFADGEFHGYADFLLASPDGWVVADSKIARRAKTTALLQVAAYADQLEALGFTVAPEVRLILGTGDTVSFPRADLMAVFRERRTRLRELIADHRATLGKAAWDTPGLVFCGSCDDCSTAVADTDDLLQVANLRRSQRARLKDAGIHTMTALADATTWPTGMNRGVFDRLVAQAALQAAQLADEEVRADVFDPLPILALPEPTPGDLFFDFEGDPIHHEPGSERWGLEYLWGVQTARKPDGSLGEFWHLWADDRMQERAALVTFLDTVAALRQAYPAMHVYHYAAYEVSALKRLVAEFKTHEEELDDLLRHGVFVDLYATVRGSVRVSQPSYSIKKLEPLYMDHEREGLAAGDDSIVQYGIYREKLALDDASRTDEQDDLLQYNRYDCESTLELRDWLLRQLPPGAHAAGPDEEVELTEQVVRERPPERVALSRDLLARAGPELRSERTDEEQAWALLEGALDYHRREDKPFWWAHFDRLMHEPDEWADTKDVVLVQTAEVVEDWGTTGKQKNARRTLRLTGRPGPGSTLTAPGSVRCVYAAPAPDGVVVPARGLHGATDDMKITDVEQHTDGTMTVTAVEVVGKGQDTWSALPLALTPTPGPRTGQIAEAIASLAQQSADAGALPAQPAVDVLARREPRLIGLPGVARTGDRESDLVSTLLALDRSYLAVQGPPGTGKTYLGSLVIKRLVKEHGWRIGVVGQSHAVVENLLDAVVGKGLSPAVVAKRDKRNEAATWVGLSTPASLATWKAEQTAGYVVGGTVWGFVGNAVEPEGLDLLVVDEAGQFCLANTLAVSTAAQRLLLLGDPQQLPQVSQGCHGEPVDDSALSWVIGASATLPEDLGYFLETSYRMHPAVCEVVSRLSYDGKLHAADAASARSLEGVDPGVEIVLVDHGGRSVSSPEEAAVVVEQVRRHVGARWHDGAASWTLGAADVLVVAPYNAQRVLLGERLAEAGLGAVRVGTVDKFQGQEAPVVVVSMTASSQEDVPRGMEFLLNRNRVNVAVSRAQWKAVVVRSRSLTAFMPTSTHGLLELGGFLGLGEPVPARMP